MKTMMVVVTLFFGCSTVPTTTTRSAQTWVVETPIKVNSVIMKMKDGNDYRMIQLDGKGNRYGFAVFTGQGSPEFTIFVDDRAKAYCGRIQLFYEKDGRAGNWTETQVMVRALVVENGFAACRYSP